MVNSLKRFFFLFACIRCLYVQELRATSTTWQGTDGASWTVGGNWTAGVPGSGDTAIFITPSSGSSTGVAGPATVSTIQFNRTANTFTISATPLTLSTGATITDGASNAVPNIIDSASIVLSSNLSVTSTQVGSGVAISGLISESGGARSISVNGVATLTLSGANTFSGGVSLLAGSLALGGNSGLGSGTLSIANGTTFTLLSAITTVTNNISLTGGSMTLSAQTGVSKTLSGSITQTSNTILLKSGTGTVIFSNGANNYTGGTQVSAGVLQAGAANVFGSGPLSLTAGTATLNLNGFNQSIGGISSTGAGQSITLGAGNLTSSAAVSTSHTFNGTITGSGLVTFSGTGTQIYAGTAKAYTGGTTISLGSTLQMGANSMLPASGTTTVNGTLSLLGTTQSIGALSGTTGSITSTAGSSLTSTSDGSTAYNGTIAGNTSFTFSSSGGTGILTLGGSNTYSGGTSITSGANLTMGANNALPSSGTVTVNGTLDLVGTTQSIGPLQGTTGSINSSAGASFTSTSDSSTPYNGVITGNTSFTFSSSGGTGILTLGGATNSYSGGTTIGSGAKIALITAGNLPTTNTVTVTGTLDISQVTTSATCGTLAGAGNIFLGARTLNSTTNSARNFSGVIADGGITPGIGGSFTKDGTFTQTLSGVNTYTGGTSIFGGIIRAGIANTIATSTSLSLSNIAGVEFDTNSFNQTVGTLSGGGNSGGNVRLRSATVIVNQGSDQSYGGSIFDSGLGGSFTKAGASRLTLTQATSYIGATSIQAGKLQAGVANIISSSASLALTNAVGAAFDLNSFNQSIGTLSGGGNSGGNITLGSATLTVNQGSDQSYSGVISDTGNLIKAGSGALTLGGVNTYSGGTTISAGTLAISDDNNLGNAAGTLAFGTGTLHVKANASSNRVVTYTGSGTFDIDNAVLYQLSGGSAVTAGSFTKTGLGSMTLSGTNQYTGGSTITQGILTMGGNNVLPSTGTVTVNATLALQGTTQSIGPLQGTTGSITSTAGSSLTSTSSATTTYSGTISGNTSLTFAGSGGTGTLALGGVNSYSGGTTIQSSGTLAISDDNQLGNAAGTLAFNTGTLHVTANASSNRVVTYTGSGTFDIDNAVLYQLSGGSAVTAGSFTKTGLGSMTLSGTNQYTGGSTITQGILTMGGNNVLPSTGTVTVNATLALQGTTQSIGPLSGTTGSITSAAGSSLTSTSATTTTYNGTIAGNTSFTLAGAGVLILGGANTYSGGTTISGGTLQMGANSVLPSTGTVTVNATLALLGTTQSIGPLQGTTGSITSTAGSSLTSTSSTTTTYSGTISGNTSLTFAGSGGTGTLALGGVNSYSGGTTIQSSGTLAISDDNQLGNAAGTLAFNTGTLHVKANASSNRVVTYTGSGTFDIDNAVLYQLSGGSAVTAGSFTKTGLGSMTLSGTNQYTGGSTITQGILTMGGNNVLPSTGTVTVNATLALQGTTQSIGPLQGTTGSITSAAGSSLTSTSATTTTYNGTIAGNTSFTFAGSGGGMLILGSANTYSGATTITGGTLRAGIANVIANSASLALSNVVGAVFDLNSLNQSIGTLSGGGNLGGNITLGSATLTVNQGSNQSYGGLISGTGNLIKAGSFRLTISQAATYTGTTSIQAGILQAGVANVIASSSSLTFTNAPGAAFDLNNFNQSIGTLSGGGNLGGDITLGSATLTVNQGSDLSYGGLISGTGNLIKAGPSRLTLSRATTYTGTTSIQAGSLQAGIANVIANSSALAFSDVAGAVFDLNSFNQSIGTLSGGGTVGGNITLGSATLTVNQGSDQTYGGAISGSGPLFKQGAATLALTGSNSYTGLTTVAAGTLQGNTGSLPGNIDNYSTLIWNQTSPGTYSHNITQSMGPGAMKVQGGALLTTTGSLVQDTITVLNGGQMAIDGTATATTITVNSGGYLIGQGSVTGNVDVFGTLGAGDGIGTLTVTGNYTQENGSTFLVEIIPTAVDLLEVSNTIALGDHVATFSLMPTLGDYPSNQQYTVMHGAGGITGRFIEPITSSLPSFTATLHYTPIPTLSAEHPPHLGDPPVLYVILLVNTVTPSHLPISPTALIAARCFDSISNNPFSEFLLFMQIPQMNMTLTGMLPSVFGSLDLTQQDLMIQVREVATREMNLFLKNPCMYPQRFRVWADVFVPSAMQHCRHDQMGYYSSAVGEALGFDCQIGENSFLGAFAAYAQNHLKGKGTYIDGWMHNIYGNFYAGGWISPSQQIYGQAVLSGSYDHYHTVRSIYFAGEQFDAFTKTPRASFDGCSGLGSFEIGKLWQRVSQNQLYGRVDYSFNYRNSFQEYHASSLNLHVKSHFSDFIRLELGDALSRCFTLQNTLLDARLAAGGVLEYQINGKKQKAGFMDTSCVMASNGPTLGRAFLFWELGAQIHIKKNYIDVIAGNFRGEYGSGFVSHNWSVELKSSF